MDKTQIYFADTKTPKKMLVKEGVEFLKSVSGVKEGLPPEFSDFNFDNSQIKEFVENSFNRNESGDIIYYMYSGWMEERSFGTTHNTSYTSDTHVPLLWYGCNIPNGETVKHHSITQIAPTLSMLLDIPLPNASNTNPMEELFNN